MRTASRTAPQQEPFVEECDLGEGQPNTDQRLGDVRAIVAQLQVQSVGRERSREEGAAAARAASGVRAVHGSSITVHIQCDTFRQVEVLEPKPQGGRAGGFHDGGPDEAVDAEAEDPVVDRNRAGAGEDEVPEIDRQTERHSETHLVSGLVLDLRGCDGDCIGNRQN
jgi:hypothetical protein